MASTLTAEKPKHAGGRPTKYNPELVRKSREYLDKWHEYGHKIPSISGLAQVIDVTRERIAIWRQDKNKGEFSRIISKLMAMQETKLLDNGLDGTFNSAITKLCLSKHGYTDAPQSNQANTGIQVHVNRGSVVLKAGQDTLEITDDKAGNVLEHKP